jgi:hypothetical protein
MRLSRVDVISIGLVKKSKLMLRKEVDLCEKQGRSGVRGLLYIRVKKWSFSYSY